LEEAGYYEGAIRQATEAGDHELTGLLIARYWREYVFFGQTATVQRWLRSLPGETISRDAPLALVKAWICALGGQREESLRCLSLAQSIPHEGPLPDGTASVESGVAILRASFGYEGIQSTLEAARLAVKLEPLDSSPWAAMARFALGTSQYLAGNLGLARRPLEEALELSTAAEQPLLTIVIQTWLSTVAVEEGHQEEAEARARTACDLVERFRLAGSPQASQAPIALGRALAERGDLEQARKELENGLSVRRKLPGLSPWPTLIGLLALAPVLAVQGDRAGARATLAEARSILDAFPDAGIFPELLEHRERGIRARKPREAQLDQELTERELDVLRLLAGELPIRQIARSLYVAPSTVRTQVKSIYRKLGVSSRGEAVKEARARGLI
jgi:LuxR family maltose regulon positive regulatory protein